MQCFALSDCSELGNIVDTLKSHANDWAGQFLRLLFH